MTDVDLEWTHEEVLWACGGCPECGQNDGHYMHMGFHEAVSMCDKHKTKWIRSWPGPGIPRWRIERWQNMTDGERDAVERHWRELEDYTYVKPVLHWPRR